MSGSHQMIVAGKDEKSSVTASARPASQQIKTFFVIGSRIPANAGQAGSG